MAFNEWKGWRANENIYEEGCEKFYKTRIQKKCDCVSAYDFENGIF